MPEYLIQRKDLITAVLQASLHTSPLDSPPSREGVIGKLVHGKQDKSNSGSCSALHPETLATYELRYLAIC